MFTTEAGLSQRIERLIAETPKIDPHTHIPCDQRSAPDLASLMSYHWVKTELSAVGMPATDFDPALPGEERVRRAIPYLSKIRNTAMSWCLFRIFRDLFDFHDPVVTSDNYLMLVDRVLASGRDASWPTTILKKKCNIEKFVTSLGNRSSDPSKVDRDAFFMLDAHYLMCPGVATDLTPFFVGRTTREAYYEVLVELFGDHVAKVNRLETAIHDWLDRVVTDRTRFSNTFLPIEQRFVEPDSSTVQAVLDRAAPGAELSDEDIDTLVRFVSWKVLEWHHQTRKAFQIAVGAEYFICDGKSIPRYQQTWTTDMCRVFHRFSNARFDIMAASDLHVHETAVVARQFPNVYVSGYWWHNFFPITIERIVALRLQVAPMVKIGGFLCDAYYAEWTYGKLQVVKKGMSRAIAGMVESGLLEEDEVPAILNAVLHDSPRDLYDLGERD